jgi:hypothetical protein
VLGVIQHKFHPTPRLVQQADFAQVTLSFLRPLWPGVDWTSPGWTIEDRAANIYGKEKESEAISCRDRGQGTRARTRRYAAGRASGSQQKEEAGETQTHAWKAPGRAGIRARPFQCNSVEGCSHDDVTVHSDIARRCRRRSTTRRPAKECMPGVWRRCQGHRGTGCERGGTGRSTVNTRGGAYNRAVCRATGYIH